MKTLVIINPVSRGGKTKGRWPHIKSQLKASIGGFDHQFTQWPDHATDLARAGLKQGYERIIAIGGDGTLSEVVNGFFEEGELINPDALYGVIHAGTGGDFCRNLGLGPTLEDQIVTLKEGHVKKVSLGHADYHTASGKTGRYFIVICAFGFSSSINKAVNDRLWLKKYFGPVAFIVGVLGTLFSYKNTLLKFKFSDGQTFDSPTLLGAACNGPFTGGGMKIAPDADILSDSLDYVVAGNVSGLKVLPLFPKLYKGNHLSEDEVSLIRTEMLEVEPLSDTKQTLLDMDGDVRGHLPATIKVVPNILKVIC